jgi:uncharacterized protein (TIGR02118 family)
MELAWVRLRMPPESGASALRTYRVLRPRADRPESIELFDHDPDPFSAWPVEANRVVVGAGPVNLVVVLYRRPDVDRAFFSQYWRYEHAQFGRRIPNVRNYTQFHARGDGGPDGVCLVGFDSVEDLRTGLGADVIAIDARADEERFIDRTRSFSMVCAED